MAVLYTAFTMDQLSLEMPFALIFYNLNNNFMFHSWVTALASGNKEVVKWASLESSATVSSEAGVPPLMSARHSDTGDFHCIEKKFCPSLTFCCLSQREMCATFKRQHPPSPPWLLFYTDLIPFLVLALLTSLLCLMYISLEEITAYLKSFLEKYKAQANR